MTVLLDRCSTFVPDAYRWVWIREPLPYEAPDEVMYRRERICHRCERPRDEHEHEVVEIYTAAGPFMVAPPDTRRIAA